MSQSQPSPSPPLRRHKRTITRSQRARESDEYIPGIDSVKHNMRTPTSSPAAGSEQPSKQSSPAYSRSHSSNKIPHNGQTRTNTRRPARRFAGRRPTIMGAQRSTSSNVHAPPALTSTEPSRTTFRHQQSQDQAEQFLRMMSVEIFPWPKPGPVDFTKLSPTERRWRQDQEQREILKDGDEDLDDWFVKSGNAAAYSTTHPRLSLQYSITRSFIMRAKRAFWRGQSWQHFEDKELAIDSMSEVRKIRDDRLRAIHAKEAVDNNLRLAIFSRIRPRLCLEIWGEEYPVDRRMLVQLQNGKVMLREDSVTFDTPLAHHRSIQVDEMAQQKALSTSSAIRSINLTTDAAAGTMPSPSQSPAPSTRKKVKTEPFEGALYVSFTFDELSKPTSDDQ